MPTRLLFVRTFFAAFALSLLYYAVAYWRLEDPKWTLPLLLSASMPWVSTWLDSTVQDSWQVTWPLRYAVAFVLIPAGFSMNAAIIVSALTALARRVVPAHHAR